MSRLGVQGVDIPGVLGSVLQPRGPNVLPLFEFDIDQVVFTPGMAKRTSAGPFETAPICQGDWAGTGQPDVVTFPRGDQLGNPTKVLYSNLDPYQGSIVFWITPEWDGNDGIQHYILDTGGATELLVYKTAANNLHFSRGGQSTDVDISAWVAGTTYHVCLRWSILNPIDGTNYLCSTVNNVRTYGAPTQPSVGSPWATFYWGSRNAPADAADAILEGFTVYRRVLYDGTYGTDVNGGLDELTAIYAAGAGVDPTTLTGSNDVVFCLPTDSTAGALVTGTGEAWSHPLDLSLPDDTFLDQGNMPGGDWGVVFNGTSSYINCGSDASLDDMPSGAVFTADIWVRYEVAGGLAVTYVISKWATNVGWRLSITAAGAVAFRIELATTDITAAHPTNILDGKWHLITTYYDDAAKRARIAVDGIWGNLSTLGVGAYQSDAARNLEMGRLNGAGSNYFTGAIAWVELSDNDRHTAGTDFQDALPTAPFNDGNTIEAWDMETGSGATAVAMVNTPANDGTITSGTWEAVWNRELTPVEIKGVKSNPVGSTWGINCGDGATINDLPDGGAMTIEIIARADADSLGFPTAGRLLAKGNNTAEGISIHYNGTAPLISATVVYDTTSSVAAYNGRSLVDKVKHHIAITYDEGGDRRLRMWIDGALRATGTASVGNYVTDAARDFMLGNVSTGTAREMDGAFFFGRISDSVRYTKTFTPPTYDNPPAVDGNTMAQWNFTEGTGATVADETVNANDGVITNGDWLNSTDMEVVEPGALMYHSGKVIGSDQALDGIKIQVEPTNPVDCVIIPRLSVGQDGRARPIVDYNGTQFKYPKLHGTHTGAGGVPCEDADGAWSQHILGWTLYNIDAATSGVPTAIDGDGQGVTGGPNFGVGEEYLWRPPNGDNYCQHPIGVYGIWVLRTAAAVVELQVVNGAGEGSIQVHQVEVQESSIANGDHEAMAGNPAILTGWTNNALGAGDTAAEAAIIHSGAQSMRWAVGAASEGQYEILTPAPGLGSYIFSGVWVYGDGTQGMQLMTTNVVNNPLQFNPTQRALNSPITAAWQLVVGVWRVASGANMVPQMYSDVGAAGNRYTDDVYSIVMNPVSLTVTPASEANSLEGTGLRVDGFDDAQQPILPGQLQPSIGHMRFFWTPRHNAADFTAFGVLFPVHAEAFFDANRRIAVFSNTFNTIRLLLNDGGGVLQASWDCTGQIVAGTRYAFDVIYVPAWIRLYVDGIQRIEIVTPVAFTAIPNVAYWGKSSATAFQSDVVIG